MHILFDATLANIESREHFLHNLLTFRSLYSTFHLPTIFPKVEKQMTKRCIGMVIVIENLQFRNRLICLWI